MSVINYPKILFIADEIPQSINAGSIQFFRLFNDYPADRLMIIGREPAANAETLKCKYHTLTFNLLDRIRMSRFSSYLTDLQSLGLFLPKLPKRLKKVADEFKPDIVISLMQLITFYYPAYYYAKIKKTPLLLFCHDDVEDFARPHPVFKKLFIELNAKIYQSASKRICISPEMAEAWQAKYNAEGTYLYPTSSDNIQGRDIAKAETLVNENQLTIGYAGSLAYGYREGIKEIIPTLENTGARIRIYRNKDGELNKYKAVEFAGYATTPEETWLRIIKECDAVILPYSQEIRFEKLYRTHFPSKLCEYLKLQMPIIVNGPSYANGVKYGISKQHFITTQNNTQLEAAIIDLTSSLEKRTVYSNAYRNINDFETDDIAAKFFQLIQL